jgi:hypothetical protein
MRWYRSIGRAQVSLNFPLVDGVFFLPNHLGLLYFLRWHFIRASVVLGQMPFGIIFVVHFLWIQLS